ncbi:MAG: glycosyltransferase [Sphingobacteriales bacterium]|nr:glycosyltransferase [Sphingobacteriales bacterium]MBI3718032.1 glycosyltransferase [Sphingobacteriales bacterium]
MFGQIVRSKGHKEVLETIVKLKEETRLPLKFSLHIKGPSEDNVYLEELKRFCKNHQLEEVVKIETGFFDKEKVIPLYKKLIVASASEAFGRVIVEANKAGLKVIVRNSGGAPELVNETNGLVYNHPGELAKILAGDMALPGGKVCMNYEEDREIALLKNWLNELV